MKNIFKEGYYGKRKSKENVHLGVMARHSFQVPMGIAHVERNFGLERRSSTPKKEVEIKQNLEIKSLAEKKNNNERLLELEKTLCEREFNRLYDKLERLESKFEEFQLNIDLKMNSVIELLTDLSKGERIREKKEFFV